MKSFLSLTLLICLAFVSMAQVASGPPVEIVEADHPFYTNEVPTNPFENYVIDHGFFDQDTDVSDIDVGELAIPAERLTPHKDTRLTPERSKEYPSASLTSASTYQWNPGYVGWQK